MKKVIAIIAIVLGLVLAVPTVANAWHVTSGCNSSKEWVITYPNEDWAQGHTANFDFNQGTDATGVAPGQSRVAPDAATSVNVTWSSSNEHFTYTRPEGCVKPPVTTTTVVVNTVVILPPTTTTQPPATTVPVTTVPAETTTVPAVVVTTTQPPTTDAAVTTVTPTTAQVVTTTPVDTTIVLPETGRDISPLLAIGLLLITFGAVMLGIRRHHA